MIFNIFVFFFTTNKKDLSYFQRSIFLFFFARLLILDCTISNRTHTHICTKCRFNKKDLVNPNLHTKKLIKLIKKCIKKMIKLIQKLKKVFFTLLITPLAINPIS